MDNQTGLEHLSEERFRTALIACLDDDHGIPCSAWAALYKYAIYMDYDVYDIYDAIDYTENRVYLPEISPIRSLEP